jgi:hypothetical protein
MKVLPRMVWVSLLLKDWSRILLGFNPLVSIETPSFTGVAIASANAGYKFPSLFLARAFVSPRD